MIRTGISAVILFGVIWFAVSNATLVNLNVFFWNVSVSAAIVIFITFVVGFIFGVVRVTPSWLRKHSQVGKHQKELQVCMNENKASTQRIKELEVELATLRQSASHPHSDEE